MNFNTDAIIKSLYLHWPFCPYKCHFCPFIALAGQDEFMGVYHKALIKEIENFGKIYSQKTEIETIFLGGGTPSTYPVNLLLDTFGILNNTVPIKKGAEITIEVNPGTVKPGQLEAWKAIGINRLSIGVQSLNNEVLKKLNRHQSAQDVIDLLDKAKDLFDNISIDLIVGLPEISNQEWQETLKQIVNWPIKHLSIYFLTVHEDTPLYFGIKQKKVLLPPDNQIVDLYYWSIDFLRENGFLQYEISNFAKPGYESKHNQAYWNRTPYKAFGLGACSFDGQNRFQNEKNLSKYINGLEQNKDITTFAESLTQEQIWVEKIMLGLRQVKGLELEYILENLDSIKKENLLVRINNLVIQDLIKFENGVISLTRAGLSLENEIVLKLIS